MRLRGRGFARCQRSLQGTNGIFKGEAVRLEDFGGDASGVTDDGGQNDGAVDVSPAASSCRRRRGLQNAAYLDRDAERILRRGRSLRRLQDAGDDVGLDPFTADLARVEHRSGIRIVTKGREQMLERNLGRARGAGELGAARQRRRQL